MEAPGDGLLFVLNVKHKCTAFEVYFQYTFYVTKSTVLKYTSQSVLKAYFKYKRSIPFCVFENFVKVKTRAGNNPVFGCVVDVEHDRSDNQR